VSSWKTIDVLTAEDVLARSVAEADQAMAKAARQFRPAQGPSAEDIRRVIGFAKSNEASPALQALQRRIAGGHLSWLQVLTGDAADDRGVRAAMDADRANIAALCRGEAPVVRRPKARREDDEPIAFTEDAW